MEPEGPRGRYLPKDKVGTAAWRPVTHRPGARPHGSRQDHAAAGCDTNLRRALSGNLSSPSWASPGGARTATPNHRHMGTCTAPTLRAASKSHGASTEVARSARE